MTSNKAKRHYFVAAAAATNTMLHSQFNDLKIFNNS